MKSTEINAIFSAKVNELLAAGYQINTNTMDGSQGEIAKIDFRKNDEVIRLVLHRETIWGESFRATDAIVLTVGRCNDERVISAKGFTRDAIIWNNRLETIEERTFFQIGERRGADWYLEGEEAVTAIQKNRSRWESQWENAFGTSPHPKKEYKDEASKKAVLPAVRRHLGKPKMKLERIDTVTRRWDENNNRYEYVVKTVGKNIVRLH